jgi:4-hydroxy-tetrahydrodipicolinate reductase
MTETTRIGVVGAAGRMGRMLLRAVAETEGCKLIGATEAASAPDLGRDLGELAGLAPMGVALTANPMALFAAAEVVIDFTTPAATVKHAEWAAQGHVALVAGTTGLDSAQEAALAAAARHVPLVYAPNMSLGVNLLMALVEEAAKRLPPEMFDIEIVEMHHRAKSDAPSGTALALGRAAAKGRGVELQSVAVRGRDGQTGSRKPGTIGLAALRGGDVAGDHTVIYAGEGERIELIHRASDRAIFARGAVRAALWTRGRAPGLYSMRDVLGL